MKTVRRGRLRVPLVMLVGGSALAAVAAVGQGWPQALGTEAITLLATIGYYLWGARDSDAGAIIGHHDDERQSLLRTQAQALSGVAMTLTAVIGFAVSVALKQPLWPFELFAGVGVAAFAAGLALFGARAAR